MELVWHDLIGTCGVILVIGAYCLSQFGVWKIDNPSFPLVNAFGALFILISLYYEFNLSAFLVEFAWLLISVVSAFRLYYYRKAITVSDSMPPASHPPLHKDE